MARMKQGIFSFKAFIFYNGSQIQSDEVTKRAATYTDAYEKAYDAMRAKYRNCTIFLNSIVK